MSDEARGSLAPGGRRWHAALDAHCERFLGPCPSVFGEIVPSSDFNVSVCPHQPSPGRPWLTLRTAGVSDHPMSLPDDQAEHRCELLTYLPPDWVLEGSEAGWWPGSLLKVLGQFVHERSTWFAEGHTVLVSEAGETYAPGTLVSAVLLRAPDVEARPFGEFALGGTACRFLWFRSPRRRRT